MAVRNSLSWGNRGVDIFIKGGSADKDNMSDHNITLNNFQVKNLTHSLMGSNNVYNPDPSKDNIRYQYEAYCIRYQEFADPDNFDFKLQATSKFRNSGPDGKDRGPFLYKPDIFYVTPKGDDAADGMSMSHAWRNLANAMNKLKAGDTLYLEPGVYQTAAGELDLSGKANKQSITAIRVRGHGQVVIQGKLNIIAGSQLSIERITFTDTLTVRQGSSILVKNCIFVSADVGLRAQNIQGLRLTHHEFAGFKTTAIDASQSSGLFISANIFGNQNVPAVTVDDAKAVLYCDYNAYANSENAWRVAGATSQLPDLYRITDTPDFEMVDHLPVLRNARAFAARGIDGRNVGFHQEYPDQQIHVTIPQSVLGNRHHCQHRVGQFRGGRRHA